MESPMELQLLQAVVCVVQAKAPTVVALDHVLQLLDAFLDVSVLISLEKAAANGSIALFDRVLEHTLTGAPWPINHEILVEHKLSKAIEAAVVHGNLAAIQRIHAIHPAPLSSRVIRYAAAKGDLAILQWLLQHRTDGLCIPAPFDPSANHGGLSCCLHLAYQHAINNKHLHIIRWLFEAGYIDSMRGAGDAAASMGDLDMVKWIHAQTAARSFSAVAIDNAAREGHLKIVQFLLENRSDGCTSAAVNGAILGGHDEILELLRAHRLANEEVPWALVNEAGATGRLDILKWDHYAMHDPRYLDSAMSAAAEKGHLHVVQWLARNRSIKLRLAACAWAANEGHLEILKWANNEGDAGWGVEVMDRAAQSGRLQIVQWLHTHREEGCSTFAMDGAAANGHLDVVQWLHANRSEGCTQSAMDRAAAAGHLDVIQWLHKNRTEGCTSVAMDRAATHGHLHVVEWLHYNRSEGCSTEAMDGAAAGGFLEIVIWLHTHRTEGCTTKAMDFGSLQVVKWLHWNSSVGGSASAMTRAANNGDLALMQFLHENRAEGCLTGAAVQAAKKGHTYIVQWLKDHYPLQYDEELVSQATRTAGANPRRRHGRW